MPEFLAPVTGRFCWVEMHAKDHAAARRFYGELFGWSFEEMDLPEGSYTIAKVGGRQVAGVLTQPADRKGAPSLWVSYVAVDDVKASTEAAVSLGAAVVVEPKALGPGTFSVLGDPTGAIILLWHATRQMNPFLYGEPGALTWNELVTSNTDVAQRFYTRLFGWTAEVQQMPNLTYTVFKSGTTSVAGLLPQPEAMKGALSMWAAYFAVSDADAACAAAVRLGAKVLMPLVDLPDVGRFGWLQDPQGAAFAIIKNAMPA
jgi:predicted enzyme related to lactoylglutathione lyase